MKFLQDYKELNQWHSKEDPWDYRNNESDNLRKEILLSELPTKNYKNVLDIGCGQGFITSDLPGENVYGIDISINAIQIAKQKNNKVSYKTGSIFQVASFFDIQFDLVIITGVLYPQYIGASSNLVYITIDKILAKEGILASVHIDDWYSCRFPYLRLQQVYYDYREYVHNLEIYMK